MSRLVKVPPNAVLATIIAWWSGSPTFMPSVPT